MPENCFWHASSKDAILSRMIPEIVKRLLCWILSREMGGDGDEKKQKYTSTVSFNCCDSVSNSVFSCIYCVSFDCSSERSAVSLCFKFSIDSLQEGYKGDGS